MKPLATADKPGELRQRRKMQPSKQATLILGRHGQTTSNRDGFVMGRSDSPLTPQGIRTAERMARFLETRRVARVFSSPLGRAAATSRIYADHLGLVATPRESMAELGCGSWEGRPRSEVVVDNRGLRPTWHKRPPGGESYADGEIRIAPFIDELKSLCGLPWTDGLSSPQPTEQDRESTILVVGHASINRVFLKLWLKLHTALALKISCPHDTVYILEPDGVVAARNSDGGVAGELLFERV
jgi:broad specificity phosphatase PhoE